MIRNQSIFTIGFLLVILGISMLLSAAWSLYYGEPDLIPILQAMVTTIIVGGLLLLLFRKRDKKELSIRDGFTIVTLGWIAIAIFSALPFFFSGYLNYTNSFFEAMSGLTTTGASVLGHHTTHQIEDLPHGLLFWRSFTHFIGGMGIIVFSIAILPMLGMGGVQLFRAEVAGPTADKLTPRVKQTAKLLWGIYVGFVLIETLILRLEGMLWFDAICHAFGTMATGGFSTKNASIAAYGSLVQWTIIFFMFCAATNFSLHYFFIAKGNAEYFKDREFSVYTILICLFSLIFLIDISNSEFYKLNFDSLRHSVFTAISLLTTTGFGTEDFESWPPLSKTIVFFLLFIGGSAGSTTGGMKIIRSILIFRYLIFEIRKLIHPKGIFNITIGKKSIDDDVVRATLGFYLFYIIIFAITAVVLAATGLDLTSALTASASAIGNIGPGLGAIGPTDNWGGLTDFAKWLTSFCMLLGRLEIFTVMVLFSRSFWRK
jgi:trk system potassium uptake protein TrkH